jgi:hypothetical protein
MLLDRGPIDPIDVDAQFAPSSLPPLEGVVAETVAQLGAGDAALAGQQSIMASDDEASDVIAGGLDLATADEELAGQAGALDSAIGGVAAAADVQDGDIPGLSNESVEDASASTAIDWPPFTDHANNNTPPTAPPVVPIDPELPQPPYIDPGAGGGAGPAVPVVDAFAQAVVALYAELLDRTPSADEIAIHRGNPGGLAGVRQTILDSDEYRSLHGG